MILQLYHVVEGGVFFVLIKYKIQNANGVDVVELKVPVSFWRLFLNGKGTVENTAIFEVILFGFLHFYDKSLAIASGTIEVEHGIALKLRVALLLPGSIA